MTRILSRFCIIFCLLAAVWIPASFAQLFSFPKEELIDYTAQNPFERLPDDRPKVPDNLLERAGGSHLKTFGRFCQKRDFNNQYAATFAGVLCFETANELFMP